MTTYLKDSSASIYNRNCALERKSRHQKFMPSVLLLVTKLSVCKRQTGAATDHLHRYSSGAELRANLHISKEMDVQIQHFR